MTTFQVTVNNPKAIKLLRNLAEMNLIEIEKKKSIRSQLKAEGFEIFVKKIRSRSETSPLSMDEITAEVEAVRAERYAKRKKT